MKTGPFTFTADDGQEWRIVGPSASCGVNYADIERVSDGKQSVRVKGLLKQVGHEIPNDVNLEVDIEPENVNPQVEKIPAPHPVGCECGNCSHEHYGCLICGDKDKGCTPTQCVTEDKRVEAMMEQLDPHAALLAKASAFIDAATPEIEAIVSKLTAGRYVLTNAAGEYCTSWDTWEETAFPLDPDCVLEDTGTGNRYVGDEYTVEEQESLGRPRVVNMKTGAEFDIYIGRPGPWGNPYSHLPDSAAQHRVATRDDAISYYREWLKTRIREQEPGLVEALAALCGQTLGCYCAPESCHGDVLADAAVWARGVLQV